MQVLLMHNKQTKNIILYHLKIGILTQRFLILNVSEVPSMFMDGEVEDESTGNNDAISSSLFALLLQPANS